MGNLMGILSDDFGGGNTEIALIYSPNDFSPEESKYTF